MGVIRERELEGLIDDIAEVVERYAQDVKDNADEIFLAAMHIELVRLLVGAGVPLDLTTWRD